jgi:hypothetical protein
VQIEARRDNAISRVGRGDGTLADWVSNGAEPKIKTAERAFLQKKPVRLTAESEERLLRGISERKQGPRPEKHRLDVRQVIGLDPGPTRRVDEPNLFASELWGLMGRGPRPASRVANRAFLEEFGSIGTVKGVLPEGGCSEDDSRE